MATELAPTPRAAGDPSPPPPKPPGASSRKKSPRAASPRPASSAAARPRPRPRTRRESRDWHGSRRSCFALRPSRCIGRPNATRIHSRSPLVFPSALTCVATSCAATGASSRSRRAFGMMTTPRGMGRVSRRHDAAREPSARRRGSARRGVRGAPTTTIDRERRAEVRGVARFGGARFRTRRGERTPRRRRRGGPRGTRARAPRRTPRRRSPRSPRRSRSPPPPSRGRTGRAPEPERRLSAQISPRMALRRMSTAASLASPSSGAAAAAGSGSSSAASAAGAACATAAGSSVLAAFRGPNNASRTRPTSPRRRRRRRGPRAPGARRWYIVAAHPRRARGRRRRATPCPPRVRSTTAVSAADPKTRAGRQAPDTSTVRWACERPAAAAAACARRARRALVRGRRRVRAPTARRIRQAVVGRHRAARAPNRALHRGGPAQLRGAPEVSSGRSSPSAAARTRGGGEGGAASENTSKCRPVELLTRRDGRRARYTTVRRPRDPLRRPPSSRPRRARRPRAWHPNVAEIAGNRRRRSSHRGASIADGARRGPRKMPSSLHRCATKTPRPLRSSTGCARQVDGHLRQVGHTLSQGRECATRRGDTELPRRAVLIDLDCVPRTADGGCAIGALATLVNARGTAGWRAPDVVDLLLRDDASAVLTKEAADEVLARQVTWGVGLIRLRRWRWPSARGPAPSGLSNVCSRRARPPVPSRPDGAGADADDAARVVA